ncbi:hypothetical protein Tco_0394141 [Tanacetum coccineum]
MKEKVLKFKMKYLYDWIVLHTDCVDDHFDVLDYWKYEDVYGGGCFDVGDQLWEKVVNVIGLNEDVGDDDLKDTGCSCNNDLKDLD